MYRGFNLNLGDGDFSSFVNAGREVHASNKNLVEQKLESFKDKNGNLLASEIIAGWFPPIEADVFLSHSHRDEATIIGLAGWLKQKFGLTSFIDSCIWGYSTDLLKMIDDEYCYNQSEKTYNYQKRNRSTGHVHMMLSTALSKMINSCECIIFANTPNSISAKDYIRGATTDSPWIYSEIAMTSIVQKRAPNDHRRVLAKSQISNESISESLQIKYDVDLGHLTSLDINDLIEWHSKNQKSGSESLDTLYSIK
ncbi:hypothetical protein N7373_09410 [Achromobacter mucicolens]|uniref:hypothetical protein n=1 Tax=Achromobacter mucicolens TaxID=1389922 RepID=UPI0024489A11|nr:hypothetical protein [Achromobacter mucicolens]MDH0091659.1 hypothetical protein [Achromobacter mucicolens]